MTEIWTTLSPDCGPNHAHFQKLESDGLDLTKEEELQQYLPDSLPEAQFVLNNLILKNGRRKRSKMSLVCTQSARSFFVYHDSRNSLHILR